MYGKLTYDTYRLLKRKTEYSINDAGKSGLPVWKKNETGFLLHTTYKNQLKIDMMQIRDKT